MKLRSLFDGPAPLPVVQAAPVQPSKQDPLALRPAVVALFAPTDGLKYEAMARGLEGLQAQISGITVRSADDAANVQRILAEAKRGLKTCEDTRLSQTKPLRDKAAAINDQWALLTKPLEKLADACGKVIMRWNSEERARLFREQEAARLAAAEAERKAQEALAAGDNAAAVEAEVEAETQALAARDAMDAVEEQPRGIKTESGTTSSVWRKAFRIVNEAAVPHQYWTLDERKIRQAIAAGVDAIEGVYIYDEETLRTVTR